MLTNSIRKAIEHALNKIMGEELNPVYVYIQESHLKTIIFSIINSTFLNSKLKDIEDSLAFMQSLKLLGECTMDYYCNNKILLDVILREFLTVHEQYTADDISSCYNSLLTSEISISNGRVHYKIQKNRRDMTGSYYTPDNLALNTVKKTLKTYFEKNPTSNTNSTNFEMKIIDLSCGCGEFLVMCKKCLVDEYSLHPNHILNWFYGADVDTIAIQITIARIYSGCEIPDYNMIHNHFFIGNSLYRGECTDDQLKFKMFSEGRYYSKENGILAKISKYRFDIVIGNPPWEKIRFEDRKFFRLYSSKIADITKKSERDLSINELKKRDLPLHTLYMNLSNDYSSLKSTIVKEGFLKESVLGELNTYALFTELSIRLMKNNGVCGLILKSSIMTSPVYSPLFKWFTETKIISDILFFNNSNKIFDIDSREQFCIAIFKSNSHRICVSFGLTRIDNFDNYETIGLTKSDILLLNPLTCQIPGIQSNEQLFTLLEIHKRCPLFSEVFPDCHYGRLVHLTSHSNYISSAHNKDNLPILEGKMIGLYTSHHSSFSNVDEDKKYLHKSKSKLSINNESFEKQCRLFIKKDAWKNITKNYQNEYSLYWRSLTSNTNNRTMIATIDKHMPSCQSVQLLQCDNFDDLLIILGLFNSSTFDYILRMKLCGIDLTQKIIKQMPVPSKKSLMSIIEFRGVSATIYDHLISRVRYLLRDVIDESYDSILHSTNSYEIIADIDEIVSICYSIRN